MSSTFTLRLDRTAPLTPTLAINGGAAYTTSVDVTADLTVADTEVAGFLVKIWGADVDLTANPNIQDTEAASTWVPLAASVAVRLTAGDGSKTLSARFRDDVGNTSGIISDSITLDTTMPVVTITVPFTTGVQAADLTYKISEVTGFDKADGAFQADVDIQRWEVRVVPSTGSPHTAGTLLDSTAGSTNVSGGVADSGSVILAATTNKAVQIDGTDLYTASASDGDKIIKIFVQDLAGNWSA